MAESTSSDLPVNGAGDVAAAELERRRALDRERNKRYRERQRTLLEQSHPAPATGPTSRPAAGAPPIHETRPLTELGEVPDAFLRAAPPVVHADPVDAVADAEGARKFAALVSLVFKVALDDATERYDLGRFAGELGATVNPTELDAAKGTAVRFVFAHAERCALKHGLGISLPWEDELVTLGAAGGSVLYLAAKFTGRLNRQSTRTASPAMPGGAGSGSPPDHRPNPSPDDDDEPDSDFTPLRVDRRADGLHH